MLGPIPDYMRLHSPGLANMFLTAGGQAYEVDHPQMTSTCVCLLQTLPHRSLKHLLIEEMTPELFAASELNGFVNLVSQMLVLDPSFSPPASSTASSISCPRCLSSTLPTAQPPPNP